MWAERDGQVNRAVETIRQLPTMDLQGLSGDQDDATPATGERACVAQLATPNVARSSPTIDACERRKRSECTCVPEVNMIAQCEVDALLRVAGDHGEFEDESNNTVGASVLEASLHLKYRVQEIKKQIEFLRGQLMGYEHALEMIQDARGDTTKGAL